MDVVQNSQIITQVVTAVIPWQCFYTLFMAGCVLANPVRYCLHGLVSVRTFDYSTYFYVSLIKKPHHISLLTHCPSLFHSLPI